MEESLVVDFSCFAILENEFLLPRHKRVSYHKGDMENHRLCIKGVVEKY